MLENLLEVICYNVLETCRLQSEWRHNSHNDIHNSHNGIDKLPHQGFPVVAGDAGKTTSSNILFSLAT